MIPNPVDLERLSAAQAARPRAAAILHSRTFALQLMRVRSLCARNQEVRWISKRAKRVDHHPFGAPTANRYRSLVRLTVLDWLAAVRVKVDQPLLVGQEDVGGMQVVLAAVFAV